MDRCLSRSSSRSSLLVRLSQTQATRSPAARQPQSHTRRLLSTSSDYLTKHNLICCRAAAVAVQDDTISIAPATMEDGLYTVKGTLRAAESPTAVYSLLTNYEGASQVFSQILSSSVEERDGQKHVNQVAEWKFLLLSGSFNIALLVDEVPQEQRLTFRAQDSTFMKDFQGRWTVYESEGTAGSVVEYVLSLRLAMPFPVGITGQIFEKQVLEVLQDLESALQR